MVSIVILLWFYPYVRHAQPCEHNRNTILCLFIKLRRHVNYEERMNPIDFGDQRSRSQWIYNVCGNNLINTAETIVMCILKLGRRVNHGERMKLIDFGGQRSDGNKHVYSIETKQLCASSSNLADMLTMVREWSLDFGGQRSRSQWTFMEITLWTQ